MSVLGTALYASPAKAAIHFTSRDNNQSSVSVYEDATTTHCKFTQVLDKQTKILWKPCIPGTFMKIVHMRQSQAINLKYSYVIDPSKNASVAVLKQYSQDMEKLRNSELFRLQSDTVRNTIIRRNTTCSSDIVTDWVSNDASNWQVDASISYYHSSDCSHVTFTNRTMSLGYDKYTLGLQWYGSWGFSASAYAGTNWNPCAVTWQWGTISYGMNSYQPAGYYFVDRFDFYYSGGCSVYQNAPQDVLNLGPLY